MTALPVPANPPENDQLPVILKAIRRRRGVGVAEVAKAMGIGIRTYADFEAGRSHLNVARIHHFARVVGADPYAILVALEIKSPTFALRCVDNQLMAIILLGIKDFDARAKDNVALLDPRTLIAACQKFFDGLIAQSGELDAYLERWMLDRSLHELPPREDPDRDTYGTNGD
jgi:transcriptional regulator with XRE-family HTH domain